MIFAVLPSVQELFVYDTVRPRRFHSIIYNLLIHTVWIDEKGIAANIWKRFWRKSCLIFSGPVRTTIHGRSVVVNYGHTYPVYARRFHSFNNPILELVFQCYSAAQAPVTLVDVGANVGDTILLLESNCPGMLGSFYCIEGDPEFYAYLQRNLGHRTHGHLIHAMLSASHGTEQQLLRIHAGTASAQGAEQVTAQPLDTLLAARQIERIDILKTDVDGFDGKVLLGSRQILERYRPAVIFEWHPALCRNTGNSWSEHFDALGACGYSTFIWFTKYGEWSHFMHYDHRGSIDMLADFCLHSTSHVDWHYDVIALHEYSSLSPTALADLMFARARRSPY